MENAVVFADGELGTTIHRGGGIFFEAHDHDPLHKDDLALHDDIQNLHIELFTARGKPVAHRLEISYALDPLDAILEDDLIVIVGKDVRPVRFALFVVSF